MCSSDLGHGSKGRERPRVFWIQTSLRGNAAKYKPWELQQEENLKYVIATRAQKELILLSESMIDDKKAGK